MIILLFIPSTVFSLEIALFPSTGCYSHDVMMRHIGETFDENDNITWIQTFLYDFGFGEIQLPSSWTRISLWGHDADGFICNS
uniref:Secreted protein n=1 Tax=Heterorhabditis bacteriophora TaxID=37862 RepID=A0A1I7XPE2_HETBA